MTEYQLRENQTLLQRWRINQARDLGPGSCVWPSFSLPPSVTLDVGRERNGKLEVSPNLTCTALFCLEFYIKKDYYSYFADDTWLAN